MLESIIFVLNYRVMFLFLWWSNKPCRI